MDDSLSLPELLDVDAITRRVMPIHKRTLRRMVVAGTFPPCDVKLSEKLIFWRRDTIAKWLSDPQNWGRK